MVSSLRVSFIFFPHTTPGFLPCRYNMYVAINIKALSTYLCTFDLGLLFSFEQGNLAFMLQHTMTF